MAYAGAVTVTRKGSEVTVEVAETEGAAASEATIEIGFTKGRLLRQMVAKTSGSATTYDPILGIASNPSGNNVVVENDTAGGVIDNSWTGGVPFNTPTGILYHRSVPDAGTDNTTAVVYLILVGWGR